MRRRDARRERRAWVSYLRVSTPGQARSDLSVPAQRHAIAEYAARHGATIAREYVEAGHSALDPRRPVFRQMLADVLATASDVAVIVVHHTSRFTRDATEARVVKRKLRKAGVRILFVCQEIQDDPMGNLIEGIFECIDQYESEINGLRTSAAMAEAVRQGFFPGGRAPYGYERQPVEIRPGVTRRRLVKNEDEAEVVRELFQLYVSENGAKSVARTLNQRGHSYRGRPWSKDLVLYVLANPAAVGTLPWQRHSRWAHTGGATEQLVLRVEPIIDRQLFDLAQRLRGGREPARAPGRAPSSPRLLTGLLLCGKCGASYQLETSGKKVAEGRYSYSYYNCRKSLRIGKERCPGFRIRTERLEEAVLASVADSVCSANRVRALGTHLGAPAAMDVAIARAWRDLITRDPHVARNYLQQLVDHIRVHENRIALVPRGIHSPPPEDGNENAPL